MDPKFFFPGSCFSFVPMFTETIVAPFEFVLVAPWFGILRVGCSEELMYSFNTDCE